MSGWGRNLAQIWTNNVAPSRPSAKEMCVYTDLLRTIQHKKNEKVKLLVLGSTPEFRDWGFEQNLDITVVDKSVNYYNEISREIRHKTLTERLVVSNWEDMQFSETFDLIIGDLAIGNVAYDRFDDFLDCVANALSPGGLFMGKSFFWDDNMVAKTPEEIVADFQKNSYLHPYTFMNHQLGLYCLDRNLCAIDFSKMYSELERLSSLGILSNEIFSIFQNVGWNTEMKFTFFAPKKTKFIEDVNKRLVFNQFIYTDEVYTDVFPIFVISKEDIV